MRNEDRIEVLSIAAAIREKDEVKRREIEHVQLTHREMLLAIGEPTIRYLEEMDHKGGNLTFTVRRKGLPGVFGSRRRLVVELWKGGLKLYRDGIYLIDGLEFTNRESFLRAIERLR